MTAMRRHLRAEHLSMRRIAQRYRAWQHLLDLSTRLALAGLRAQGLSQRQAWDSWCRRWGRMLDDHRRINHRIARQLYAREQRLPSKS